jgi:hypothetical protein
VIVGQTIVKLASASIGGRKVKKEAIVLVMSVLLVCFLVPILVTLAIVLTSTAISTALAGTQAIFFVLSILIFWIGSVVESLGNSHPQPN